MNDPFAPPPPVKDPEDPLIVGGRYSLPDPFTGEPRKYLRATSVVDPIKDTYMLDRWSERMAVKGIAMRPDLLDLARSHDVTEDRDELNEVVKKAKAAAGSDTGANLGTSLHKWAFKFEQGDSLVLANWETRRSLDAYGQLLLQEGILIEDLFTEKVLVDSSLDVAGRVDRIGWYGGRLVVLDLKSTNSRNFKYSHLALAVQLAIYANADFIWNEANNFYSDMPSSLDTDTAYCLHIPIGEGTAELLSVDILRGYELAKLAMNVREKRKPKGLVTSVAKVVAP